MACALALREDASDGSSSAPRRARRRTRPTAVNLRNGRSMTMRGVVAQPCRAPSAPTPPSRAPAKSARRTSRSCRRIGAARPPLIEAIAPRGKAEPVNVLTHCNAGWLATVDWGTATAPIYMAHDQGRAGPRLRRRDAAAQSGRLADRLRARPARRAAYVIADNTGGHLMQHGLRRSGHRRHRPRHRAGRRCNKIGTYLKALAAHDNDVPFYVALPSPTIDFSISDGFAKSRSNSAAADEVTMMTGKTKDGRIETVRIVPDGSRASPITVSTSRRRG